MSTMRTARSRNAATWPWSIWSPCRKRDDILEKLHHHGGDLAYKGRVDLTSDMTGHDDERLLQMIANHKHYTGLATGRADAGALGRAPAEIRQGHAGRVPPGAAGDGAHAYGCRGGIGWVGEGGPIARALAGGERWLKTSLVWRICSARRSISRRRRSRCQCRFSRWRDALPSDPISRRPRKRW